MEELQKSYEELETLYWDLIVENEILEREIEELLNQLKIKDDGFKASTEELCEYAKRINTAIEIIESYNLGKYDYTIPPTGIIELLEILKGDNNE